MTTDYKKVFLDTNVLIYQTFEELVPACHLSPFRRHFCSIFMYFGSIFISYHLAAPLK